MELYAVLEHVAKGEHFMAFLSSNKTWTVFSLDDNVETPYGQEIRAERRRGKEGKAGERRNRKRQRG